MTVTTREEAERSDVETLIKAYMAAVIGQDLDGVVNVHAANAVLEFPYSPPGFPRRVEGEAAIRDLFRPALAGMSSSSFDDLNVMMLDEPNWALVEYRGRVELKSGRSYHNTYCLVVRVEGGQLAYVREYFNPLVHHQAGLSGGE